MIRDRLKNAVRKVALKAFGMEFEASDRQPAAPTPTSFQFDPDKIPRKVDGDGDTPGPNHKELIGHTWLAAQLAGGFGGFIVDIRPPQEWSSGILQGSVLLPGQQLRSRTELLPAKTERITIVDATGEQGSEALATWLRAEGWEVARALQGGWARWVENGEPTVKPAASVGDFQLGDPVELTDGRRGVVQSVNPGPTWDILLDHAKDEVARGVGPTGLRR